MASFERLLSQELRLAEIRSEHPGHDVFEVTTGSMQLIYIVSPGWDEKADGAGIDGDDEPVKHSAAWADREPEPVTLVGPEDPDLEDFLAPVEGLQI